MAKYIFDIWYFLGVNKDGTPDGNTMTSEERVDEACALLNEELDFIEVTLTSGKVVSCKSREELLKAIKQCR